MRDPTYTEQCEALIATLRQRLAEVEAERDHFRAHHGHDLWGTAHADLLAQCDRLRAVVEAAREVYSGPEGCITVSPCGACAWCRLGQRLSALDAQEVDSSDG